MKNNLTKKIFSLVGTMFVVGLIILTPLNNLAAEENINNNNNCRNSYIKNVLPAANSKLDSFKYFTFEVSAGVNKDSVKFFINDVEQEVSLIKKVNSTGYLAIIKGDQNLNKPGSILLKIAASGNNVEKCNANFFVGLEIKKPFVPVVQAEHKIKEVVVNISNDENYISKEVTSVTPFPIVELKKENVEKEIGEKTLVEEQVEEDILVVSSENNIGNQAASILGATTGGEKSSNIFM